MPGLAASLQSPSLFARLFIVRVLFQLTKQPALLKLHVEALQGAVDGLVRLDCYVNQKLKCLRKANIMTQFPTAKEATRFKGPESPICELIHYFQRIWAFSPPLIGTMGTWS